MHGICAEFRVAMLKRAHVASVQSENFLSAEVKKLFIFQSEGSLRLRHLILFSVTKELVLRYNS